MTKRQERIGKKIRKQVEQMSTDEVGDYATIWFWCFVLKLGGKI